MLLEERIGEYLRDLKVGKDFLEHKNTNCTGKIMISLKGHQNENSAYQKISFRELKKMNSPYDFHSLISK